MEWFGPAHPDRSPCRCRASGEIFDGYPRFLLTFSRRAAPRGHPSLCDRTTRRWWAAPQPLSTWSAAEAWASAMVERVLEVEHRAGDPYEALADESADG